MFCRSFAFAAIADQWPALFDRLIVACRHVAVLDHGTIAGEGGIGGAAEHHAGVWPGGADDIAVFIKLGTGG